MAAGQAGGLDSGCIEGVDEQAADKEDEHECSEGGAENDPYDCASAEFALAVWGGMGDLPRRLRVDTNTDESPSKPLDF